MSDETNGTPAEAAPVEPTPIEAPPVEAPSVEAAPAEATPVPAEALAAEQPPKKPGRKRRLLIGILVGVLLIAIAGITYGAYLVTSEAKEQDRKAEVMRMSDEIDESLDALWGRLATRDTAWTMQIASGMSDVPGVIASSHTELSTMLDEVDGLRARAEEIPSDAVSAAYLDVCDKLDESLNKSIASLDEAEKIATAYTNVLDASKDARSGLDATNQAITLCNKKKYNDAKTQAKTAQTLYEGMRVKLVEATELHSTEFDAGILDFGTACVEHAKMVHQLATLGAKGSINSYNSQIDKANKQFAKANDLQVNLSSAMGALGGDIAIAHGNLVADSASAKSAWTKAKKLVSGGEF